MVRKAKIDPNLVIDIILKTKAIIDTYSPSYRSPKGYYAVICKGLHIKNSLKNRLLVYKIWKRHKPAGQTPLRNTSNKNDSETNHSNDTAIAPSVLLPNVTPEMLHQRNAQNYNKIQVSADANNTSKIDDANHIFVYKPDKKSSFPYCRSVLIPESEVTQNVENLRIYIRRILPSLGINCVIYFTSMRNNKSRNSLVFYSKCKHSSCRRFKMEVAKKEDAKYLTVMFNKFEDNHVSEQYAYQLRGSEREYIKNELLLELPATVRNKAINAASPILLDEGNWQNIRSLSVFQKARSEAKASSDYDSDPYVDILKKSLSSTYGNYIHHPKGKMLVYLYSKEQLNILIPKGRRETIYFDATGSVVRPFDTDFGKRVYYYAGVVNTGEKIIPVMELISSAHNIPTLTSFFLQFKYFVTVKCQRQWPIFRILVTDWSFAIINSACFAFNEMTVYNYLKLIFKLCT